MNPTMAATHRQALLAAMERAGGGVAVFRTGAAKVRNRDAHYRFRPDSDFWYLTAFREPDAVAVLCPDREAGRFVLFVRPRDPEMETWNGRRAGVEGAREAYGADEAHPIGELDERLPALLRGARRLWYRAGETGAEDFDRKVLGWLRRMHAETREPHVAPAEIVEPGTLLHELRLHKSADELAIMRRAAAITVEGHRAAAALLAPGVKEYEIEAEVDAAFRRRGGWGPGYTSICAAGANATILHYTENDQTVAPGQLLLLDAGCEVDGYTADVTRCYPASGRFDETQRVLYSIVLDAQRRAIAQARAGNTFVSVNDVARRRMTEGLVELGLLAGDVDELVEGGADRRYTLHRVSHWLGLDVHDVGSYWEDDGNGARRSRTLEPGMVLTVEPGLYVPTDDERAPEELRGLGVRIEDDVLVTAKGNEVLTAALEKEVEAIEDLCSSRAGATA